jgi:protein-S-isoprenylcysteine O-methyltransferase Ste14
MAWLENRIPPPVLVVVIAVAMGAAAYVGPPSGIPWPWRAAAALVLFVAAGAFGPVAIRAFGRANTTVDPVRVERASTLVTAGVYARTRNPMYVSLALLLASWAAWLGHWAPLLGPVVFVLYITRFQILPEERALTARFGDDYACYRNAVRRWL